MDLCYRECKFSIATKSTILEIPSGPEPTPAVVFCKKSGLSKPFNSCKHQVVNYSTVTRSSILDVGRSSGPVSDYYGTYRTSLQRYFENIMRYFFVKIRYDVYFEIGTLQTQIIY